ncbi:MAG: calcium/sodium antiporter [SAR324 cluster bacterium]|nr:calcium/sodium antiporter [SAR324 cluster bacterium]
MTQTLLINLPIFVVAILFLWRGSDWLVESASSIASTWGISDLVIGLTVVAIGTSAPEFAVTTMAVLAGKNDISVSNVVGSNIFNLGFILGGTAAIMGVKCTPKLVYRDGIFLIFSTVLLTVLLFGPEQLFHYLSGDVNYVGEPLTLTAFEGGTLFFILMAYMVFLFIKKEPMDEDDICHDKADWKVYLMLLIGIVGVVVGGDLLVDSASSIAQVFGVSDWVIGVTIVAAGTSAPELATSITAIVKNKHGMAAGNLIGSDLFNLLGVLGVAGMLGSPLAVSAEAQSSMVILVSMVCLVVFFMRTGWRVSRLEGAILVAINLFRWIADFSSKV